MSDKGKKKAEITNEEDEVKDYPSMFVRVKPGQSRDQALELLMHLNNDPERFELAKKARGDAQSPTKQDGKGLFIGTGKNNVYYFADKKSLLDRFKLLVGEVRAGNDNPTVINEAKTILDIGLDKGWMTKKEHEAQMKQL